MENKIYTAEELRAESAELVDMLGEHNMTASMLRYAADLVERANERRGAFAVNYGRVDYESDSAIVDEIDYILHGDAKNENK